MACGTIVISNHAGFSEYIDSGINGFITDNQRSTIHQLLMSSIDKEKIKINAKVTAEKHKFTSIASEYLKIIESNK